MKSLFKLLLTAITGSLLFVSCSSDNKTGKLIPKDAALVVHVDGKSLTSKLSWDEIKNNAWFKELVSDTTLNSMQKELMQDPTITGVDEKGDFVFFMQMNASGPGQIVTEGDIKDKKKFEDYYKKLFPGVSATTQDNISFLPIKNDAMLAWKDDKFMVVANFEMPKTRNWDMGSVSSDTTLPVPPAGNSARLIETAKKTFALSKDNSLAKDEKFTALVKQEGDIHVFYNVEQMMKTTMGGLGGGMTGMMNLGKIIDGTVSTYTINFDQGKIVLKSKFYPSKDLAAIFKKYDGGDIDETMIKSIPSQNIAGVLAMSFKPEGLQELVKLMGLDGLINMALSQAGISFDDIIKANKGNLLVAVSDLNLKKDTSMLMPGARKIQPVDFLFSIGIGDKTSFDKLINAVKKMEGGTPPDDIAYNSNDKYFAVGNNPESVKKYLAGGNNTPAFWDKLKGHGFGFYADLQKIMTALNEQVKDSSGMVALTESQKMWESISSVGNGFDDGALSSTTEITLVDKNTNSLKSLNHYIDRLAAVFKAHQQRWENNWENTQDSMLTVPVPMDTVANP